MAASRWPAPMRRSRAWWNSPTGGRRCPSWRVRPACGRPTWRRHWPGSPTWAPYGSGPEADGRSSHGSCAFSQDVPPGRCRRRRWLAAGLHATRPRARAGGQPWQVAATSGRAERGEVIHGPTGRRLGYGALVDKAATLPVPPTPPLKDPKDWTLIGTPAKRLDSPDKVNGTALFGIDVRLPGMKVATLAACPVFGGKLASVDDTKARAVPGVQQVVRLDDAVAVVADHMWAAKQGLAALAIR